MSKPEKKLFLLDAMALIYRAHFAFSKNPRINSKGMNTGASFGFTNSLLEILQKEKPTHIAVAFDTFAPTFRHEAYKEYKAQRQAMPEDIKENLPLVKEIVRAFDIPVLELDGYEADDIIGTFSTQAAKAGFEVFMMTPDKDFAQLVQEHVYLYKPSYMGNGVDIMGVPEVLKKWDIEKIDQVRDILGLHGDASDNIPGIPGVGAKTAVKYVKLYGTVENLVAHSDELKGKQKENVEAFGQQGILSKELATINIKVPIAFNEDALLYSGPNEEKLTPVFDKLEFRTLMKRVLSTTTTKAAPAASPQMDLFQSPAKPDTLEAKEEEEEAEAPTEKGNLYSSVKDYHLLDTEELQKSLIPYLLAQEVVAFQFLTVGAEPIGLAFSYYSKEAYYIPLSGDMTAMSKTLAMFDKLWLSEKVVKVGHDVKQSILILKKYGLGMTPPYFDIMVAHYVIDPDTSHNLPILSENLLHYKMIDDETLIGSGRNKVDWKEVPLIKQARYVGEQVDAIAQLRTKLQPKDKIAEVYEQVELPLIEVLAEMEHHGVKVDPNTLQQLSKELEEASNIAQAEVFKMAGEEFNLASPKQLGEILFDKLKLVEKPKKTRTGQYATGEEILVKLGAEHEIVQNILDFRVYQKLKNTYTDALPEMIADDGRIHTNYEQARAATGRLSSKDPNLQNIPIRTEKGREIRKAFIPRDEDFIIMSADYSQIELRIVASFAQDQDMIDAFKQGRDIHATTASRVFKIPLEEVDDNMRRKAKAVNFGLIYGMSAFGLSERLKIPRSEAKEIMEAYFEEFSAVKNYMDRIINETREKGYVETILGRRRYLRDITSRNYTLRAHAERNAINAPIQGSAADIIKVAMIRIHQWMQEQKLKSKMILQVHDELVFDVYKKELGLLKEKVVDLMTDAIPLEVPMEIGVGTGSNWLEAH